MTSETPEEIEKIKGKHLSRLEELASSLQPQICNDVKIETQSELSESDIRYIAQNAKPKNLEALIKIVEGNKNNAEATIDIEELQSKISDRNFAEYVIGIAKRTVKCEDSLVRQILYTGFSAYSKDPINLAIIAPTSEGKTYPVMEVMKYFPKEDVWNIGAMSTKSLVRSKGILVDSNNESIESKVKELKELIVKALSKKEKENFQAELKSLVQNSKTLIDLSNKIIIFLEPPNEELYSLLKPMLSHDNEEMEFPYVDRNTLVTKNIVVRGFPSFIVCSAKDESRWSMWAEIQSRFLVTSPNMVSEKYKESNILIGYRKGLPSLIQQQMIVSNEEIELARKCILYLKNNMIEHKDDQVWIPYGEILTEILPSEKATTTRITNRIFSLIKVVSSVNAYSRPKLLLCNETSIIATLDDLSEVLSITKNLTGVPVYKTKFFNEIFYPCYNEKTEPDINKDRTKEENTIAVTTKELCNYHKSKTGRSISSDNLKKTYLNELINNGMIEQELSNINKSQYIYYPIVEQSESETTSLTSNLNQFDDILHNSGIISPKNCMVVPDNWLIVEIFSFLTHRKPNGNGEKIQLEDMQLFDKDENRISIRKFCDTYQNGIRCDSIDEYSNYENKIFGNIIYLHHNGEKV